MFEQVIDTINSVVWGPVMLILLLGTGIFLSIGLKGISVTRIPYAFKQLFKGRKGSGEGEISPFNALMTALSSTVGWKYRWRRDRHRHRWSRCAVLDVVHCSSGAGHQICRGGTGGSLP